MARIAAIALVVGALAIGACGGSGSGSSSSTAEQTSSTASASDCTQKATRLVATESSVSPFTPGPAFDIKPLKGKHFAYVADDLSVNIDQEQLASFKAAAAAAGVNVTAYDGHGKATGYAQAMTEALASHPAGIVIHAIEPGLIGAQLATAKAQGIPIELSQSTPDPAYPYYSDVDFGQEGRDMADFALMYTKCHVNGFMLYTPSFKTVTEIYDGVKHELSSLCGSNCKLQTGTIELTALATGTGPATSAALQRNPNTNILFAGFDSMANFMIPADQAAAKPVPLVSNSAVLDNLTKYVAKGDTEVADVAASVDATVGWVDLDQVMREVLKLKPSQADTKLPLQLVTKQNAATAVNFPDYSGYQRKFKASWGIS